MRDPAAEFRDDGAGRIDHREAHLVHAGTRVAAIDHVRLEAITSSNLLMMFPSPAVNARRNDPRFKAIINRVNPELELLAAPAR